MEALGDWIPNAGGEMEALGDWIPSASPDRSSTSPVVGVCNCTHNGSVTTGACVTVAQVVFESTRSGNDDSRSKLSKVGTSVRGSSPASGWGSAV